MFTDVSTRSPYLSVEPRVQPIAREVMNSFGFDLDSRLAEEWRKVSPAALPHVTRSATE
jgi:hypothetical protein